MNQEIQWTQASVFLGHPGPKNERKVWQCTIGGDVWTLRELARDLKGCKSWAVDRYSHGIRTRFAVMPSLRSAAQVVERFTSTTG